MRYLLTLMLLFVTTGCPLVETPIVLPRDASLEVSELLYVSHLEVHALDALIASDPVYKSQEVRSCLATIRDELGAVGAQKDEVLQIVNTGIQIANGSNQPGISQESAMSLWASSLLDAISGTPWVQTHTGLLTLQVQQALSLLLTPEELRSYQEEERRRFDEAMEVTQGRLIECL